MKLLSLSAVVLCAIGLSAFAQKPALTQNVDEKGRVPYQQSWNATCNRLGCYTFVDVPAGQRLVITHISVFVATSATPSLYAYLVGGPLLPSAAAGAASSAGLYLPFTDVGPASSSEQYISDRETTFYATGSGLTLSIVGANSLAGATAQVSVVGYLIPVSAVTS